MAGLVRDTAIFGAQVVQLGHETRLLEVPRRDSSVALIFHDPETDTLVVGSVPSWLYLGTHPGFQPLLLYSAGAAGLMANSSRGGRAARKSDLPNERNHRHSWTYLQSGCIR